MEQQSYRQEQVYNSKPTQKFFNVFSEKFFCHNQEIGHKKIRLYGADLKTKIIFIRL
jgi:hypothetical protein